MDNDTLYNLGEASAALGTNIQTLRRLCDSGLIPYVKRSRAGKRTLDEHQLHHARLILGLRRMGLRKNELKRYTALARQGVETLPERKALLETEKRQAWQKLEDIQRDIDFLERQIELMDAEMRAAE